MAPRRRRTGATSAPAHGRDAYMMWRMSSYGAMRRECSWCRVWASQIERDVCVVETRAKGLGGAGGERPSLWRDLHECADGVAVADDEHVLPLEEVGQDVAAPDGAAPLDHVTQALARRRRHRPDRAEPVLPPTVLHLARRVELVLGGVGGEGRRPQVERAAPRGNGVGAVGGDDVIDRLPSQRAVRALVELPRLVHRQMDQVELLEEQPRRVHCTLHDRGVHDVERVATLLE
eukprot:449112-Pleurochrysis_carterae.AAC.1